MAGFPARDILRNMHKAKKKAILRAVKYNLTKIPSFEARSGVESSEDEDGEEEEDYGRREIIYQMEDYIEYVKWVFRDRIAKLDLVEEPQTNKQKKKSRKKKRISKKKSIWKKSRQKSSRKNKHEEKITKKKGD